MCLVLRLRSGHSIRLRWLATNESDCLVEWLATNESDCLVEWLATSEPEFIEGESSGP